MVGACLQAIELRGDSNRLQAGSYNSDESDSIARQLFGTRFGGENRFPNQAAKIPRGHLLQAGRGGAVGGSDLIAQGLRIDLLPGEQTRSSEERFDRERLGRGGLKPSGDAGVA